jgi:trehalose 6-phosphate synthase
VPIPKSRGATAGGLAVALRDIMTPGSMWFGWSGRLAAEPSLRPAIVEARGVTYATVDLASDAYKAFYVGFANGVLWPLLHFRLGLMQFTREDYKGYLSVNQTYAEALGHVLEPGDTVWAHDYHLIPFGRMLRQRGFQGPMGFFLHVPFVPPSMMEAVPVGRELIEDLCAYDLLGFQTEEHARDFRDCAERMVGATVEGEWVKLNARTTRVFVDPIGIDAAAFEREADRAATDKPVQQLAGSLSGRALAIGVDRMDYSKGLPARFEAYACLLERYPEHRRKVHLLQICPRSREEVDEYRRLRSELDRLAGRINGRFSEFDWTPLRYSTRAAPRTTLAGLYRLARIGLVTPLRDGMNLVAKEYVAAQLDEDPGVLVLSKFAGAAQELTEALIVNPFDPDAIADAMHQALTMPLPERRERHRALKKKVHRTTAALYARTFIEALAPRPAPKLAA